MFTNNKPRYKHDCDGCVFLGQFDGYDLYYCKRSDEDMGGTVIARFGNDGSNYASGGCSIVGTFKLSKDEMQIDGLQAMRALRVALLIAYDRNLIGKYKDAHVKGYRIVRYMQPQYAFIRDVNHARVFVSTQPIANERAAYSQAYAGEEPNYHVEIVQIISTDTE